MPAARPYAAMTDETLAGQIYSHQNVLSVHLEATQQADQKGSMVDQQVERLKSKRRDYAAQKRSQHVEDISEQLLKLKEQSIALAKIASKRSADFYQVESRLRDLEAEKQHRQARPAEREAAPGHNRDSANRKTSHTRSHTSSRSGSVYSQSTASSYSSGTSSVGSGRTASSASTARPPAPPSTSYASSSSASTTSSSASSSTGYYSSSEGSDSTARPIQRKGPSRGGASSTSASTTSSSAFSNSSSASSHANRVGVSRSQMPPSHPPAATNSTTIPQQSSGQVPYAVETRRPAFAPSSDEDISKPMDRLAREAAQLAISERSSGRARGGRTVWQVVYLEER